MDHGFKMHPDDTLEITLPQGTKVKRVIVHEAGTQNGSLFYPESDVPDINVGDLVSRHAVSSWLKQYGQDVLHGKYKVSLMYIWKNLMDLPSAEPESPEQPESAKEYCAECDHIEMCRWYPFEGCEFRSLPSAQPEIIRCKDCKWWGREDVFKDGSSMIVCKKGRSVDPEGYCHHAERRTDEKTNKSSSC